MRFWMHSCSTTAVLLLLSASSVTGQFSNALSAEVFPCNESLEEIDFDSDPYPLVKGSTIRMCISPSGTAGIAMRSIDRFIFSKGEDNSGGRQIVIGRGDFADGEGTVVSCEPGQLVCSFVSPLKDEFFEPSTVGAETGIGFLEGRGEVTLQFIDDRRLGDGRYRTLLRKTVDLQLAPRGLQGGVIAGEAVVEINQIPIKEDPLPVEEEGPVPEDDPNPFGEFWGGLSLGAKIGIIAVLSLVFCAFCCCIFFVLKRSRNHSRNFKEDRSPRLRYLPDFGFGPRTDEFNEEEFEEDEESFDGDDGDETNAEEEIGTIEEDDGDYLEPVPTPTPTQSTGPRRMSSLDPQSPRRRSSLNPQSPRRKSSVDPQSPSRRSSVSSQSPRRGDAHRASIAQQRDPLRTSSHHSGRRRSTQSMYQERAPSSPKSPRRRSEAPNQYASRDPLQNLSHHSRRSAYGRRDDDAIPTGSQRSQRSIGSQRSQFSTSSRRSSVKKSPMRSSFVRGMDGEEANFYASPKRRSSVPRKSSLPESGSGHSRRTSVRKPPSMRRGSDYLEEEELPSVSQRSATSRASSRMSSRSPKRRSSLGSRSPRRSRRSVQMPPIPPPGLEEDNDLYSLDGDVEQA